ncbi:MAG: hypothetical protein WC444_04565 [Candidatus Paceibacterota bacterium]
MNPIQSAIKALSESKHIVRGIEVGDTLVAIDDHVVGGGPGQPEVFVSAGEHVRVKEIHDASVTVKLVDRTELEKEWGKYEVNRVDLDLSDLDHYVDAKVY